MTSAPRYCLVCNTSLTSPQARSEKLCVSGPCRFKFQNQPLPAACAICGRHLTLHERVAKVCSDAQCRVEYLHDESQRRRRHLLEQAEEWRARGAKVLGVERPKTYPLAVIPSLTTPVTNLPERRRRDFRERLMQILSDATNRRAPAPVTVAPLPPLVKLSESVRALLGAACATCQGHCCGTGGVHAYLSADTMRRFMAENPTLRPRDVLEAYLSYLPNKSLEGSCVYHTPQGCALPREMRSDISVRYFCEPLWEFQRTLEANDELKGFVAAADRDVVRAAFVSEEGRRVVPEPAKE